MENENEKKDSELLFRIVAALKKNWLLIVIVFLVVMLAGTVYTRVKKPTYSATVTVNYCIKTHDEGATEMYMTTAFFDTIVDFCDEGFVVRRANYYYDQFLKSGKSITDYVAQFDDPEYVDEYSLDTPVDEKYIFKKNITSGRVSPLTASTNTNNEPLVISIGYREADSSVVQNKVRMVALAVLREANDKTMIDADGNEVSPYLGKNQLVFDWQKTSGVSADLQVSRILLISALIGVVLALLAVYLKYLLNRTVNDKDTVEELTGVSLLAYIDDQGE